MEFEFSDDAVSRVVDAMMRGDEPLESDAPYAAEIALAFADGCAERGKARKERVAKVTADAEKRKKLLDCIMRRSYSGEGLKMSLARVAKAVAVIGFSTVTAFTASCAYSVFPELENEEYNGGRRNHKDGRGVGGRARRAR